MYVHKFHYKYVRILIIEIFYFYSFRGNLKGRKIRSKLAGFNELFKKEINIEILAEFWNFENITSKFLNIFVKLACIIPTTSENWHSPINNHPNNENYHRTTTTTVLMMSFYQISLLFTSVRCRWIKQSTEIVSFSLYSELWFFFHETSTIILFIVLVLIE